MRGPLEPGPDDAASDVACEAGDDNMEPADRDQARDLKRRAAGSEPDAQQAWQYHDLLQKQTHGRATTRAKRGQNVTCDMYRGFCRHAAGQLGRFPGGPAATPVRAGQRPVAGGGEPAQQASAEQQLGAGSGQ
ncbi:unnamed protein product, partial [Prorocentrum cordatum]